MPKGTPGKMRARNILIIPGFTRSGNPEAFHRVAIGFSAEMVDDLYRIALAEKKSFSQVVRDLVKRGISP